MENRLIKLTLSDGYPVYINPANIFSMHAMPQDHSGCCTSIQGPNNGFVFVKEHITEVIALLEDRDPAPAKVLFGGKK